MIRRRTVLGGLLVLPRSESVRRAYRAGIGRRLGPTYVSDGVLYKSGSGTTGEGFVMTKITVNAKGLANITLERA